jgi:hypothetical protein
LGIGASCGAVFGTRPGPVARWGRPGVSTPGAAWRAPRARWPRRHGGSSRRGHGVTAALGAPDGQGGGGWGVIDDASLRHLAVLRSMHSSLPRPERKSHSSAEDYSVSVCIPSTKPRRRAGSPPTCPAPSTTMPWHGHGRKQGARNAPEMCTDSWPAVAVQLGKNESRGTRSKEWFGGVGVTRPGPPPGPLGEAVVTAALRRNGEMGV